MSDVRLTATNPEDSSVVPVACNAKGELLLEEPIAPPEFDGNLDGDLTVSGTATIATDATVNTVTVGLGGGSVEFNTAIGRSALRVNTTGNQNTAIGAANLVNNTEGDFNTAVGQNALNRNTTGSNNTAIGRGALHFNTEGELNTAVGRNAGWYIEGSNNTIVGAYQGAEADKTLSNTVIISAGPTKRLQIDSGGIATFSGDVVVASRGKNWMLVEQGGLCHMVQQVRATTEDLEDQSLDVATEYPPLRDVFAELNVIEKALEEVMEKLRMSEPDGWPVWDGSDNSR